MVNVVGDSGRRRRYLLQDWCAGAVELATYRQRTDDLHAFVRELIRLQLLNVQWWGSDSIVNDYIMIVMFGPIRSPRRFLSHWVFPKPCNRG